VLCLLLRIQPPRSTHAITLAQAGGLLPAPLPASPSAIPVMQFAARRAVTNTAGLVSDSSLTITYVDEDKVVAKQRAPTPAPAPTTALPPATSSSRGSLGGPSALAAVRAAATSNVDIDLFAAGSGGGSGTSIADAFDGLVTMADTPAAAPAVVAPPSAPVPAAPAARSRGASGGVGGGGGGKLGIVEGLSPEDLMVFLSSGGAADTLTQLTISPTSVDRDGLYYLLHMLRQLDTRPHDRTFAFGPIGGPLLATVAAANELPVVLPSMHAIITRDVSSKGGVPPADEPLLWRRDALRAHIATGTTAKPAAAVAAANLLSDAAGLFAGPSPSTTLAAGASAGGGGGVYADLIGLGGGL